MSAIQAAFEAEMNSGRPIVDNANDREWGPNGQYDGPRCVDEDCTSPVDNDGELCDECGDQPHEFRPIADTRWPDWCACGRIRSIGGYSPVHTNEPADCPNCRGTGGWQQHDGLIVECPRGCMTGGAA